MKKFLINAASALVVVFFFWLMVKINLYIYVNPNSDTKQLTQFGLYFVYVFYAFFAVYIFTLAQVTIEDTIEKLKEVDDE